MQPIPLNAPGRQAMALAEEIGTAIRTVIEKGRFILGPQVEAFESEFAAYCETAQCIGAANGTDALELALRALEVGPGDRVATVANAGGYCTSAILAIGAEPLFVEVDDESMTMDPAALAAAIGSGVRAVVATHLYGRMADMPAILPAAGAVPVIEDCAQAHGAQLEGRTAGTWGAVGCYSFYPTKNLGALGDGGALITNDPMLANRIRSLGQYGWNGKYRSKIRGGRNSRLDEIQAAVLRVKLPHLNEWNRRRRAIASSYNRLLSCCELQLPAISAGYVAHLYVLRSPHRDHLRRALSSASIGCDVHYPVLDHLQESAGGRRWAEVELPVSAACCREVLTLPCFPELCDDEVDAVAEAACECLGLFDH